MCKFIIGLFLSFLLISSCCKDKPTPTQNNLLQGKLKTFEDDNYKGIVSTDSTIKYYFYYDSTDGTLKYVVNHIHTGNMDTTITVFAFQKNVDGNLYVYMNMFLQSPSTIPRKFKINKIGNQINSIVEMDTINSTEHIIANTYFLNNILDSAFNLGNMSRYNCQYHNFIYLNNNCIEYKFYCKVLDISFPPTVYDGSSIVKIKYANQLGNKNVFLQNCMDISSTNDYGLLLYVLNIDGYYMIPPNKNLVDYITEYSKNDTLITRYDYHFSGTNITSVDRSYFRSSDSINKYFTSQRMTYY